MPVPETQLLIDAIARNSGLVISLPSAGLLRHHKSRFLGEDAEGFWVESPPGDRALIDELIRTEKRVGIAFRAGPMKVLFGVPITQYNPALQINASVHAHALLLPMPRELKTIQRRSSYRVIVPADAQLSIRIWKLAERAVLRDRPQPSMELTARLRDISLGGLGVFLHDRAGGDPRLAADQRIRIELKFGQGTLLLEGRVREGASRAGTGIRTGIAFKALDNQVADRQKLAQLARIIGDLQRMEVKRIRRTA